MLGAMFSGRHTVETDECGYTFIDRDGTHFRTILNYLRTDVLEMPASGQAAEELQRELEYYMLPSAPAALKSTRKLAIVMDTCKSCTNYDESRLTIFVVSPVIYIYLHTIHTHDYY